MEKTEAVTNLVRKNRFFLLKFYTISRDKLRFKGGKKEMRGA
jgi:hypothetical protein